MTLSDDDYERYARHLILREIGGAGQMRLRAATILVIGAGGLGSPALLYLAAAGVGTLRILDDDAVALSNLQRQILHRSDDVGRPKVESAARALAALNPGVRVDARAERFSQETAAKAADGVDLILDGSDNLATRRLANALAIEREIPWVFGAVGQWEGQVSVFDPGRGGPCYACLFPEDPADGLAASCAEGGVLGALTGVIGTLMAVEAVKTLVGAGDPLRGRLLLYDALYAETRAIAVARRPDCSVCCRVAAVSP
ncbi:MAG: molybdopterin-synthase adenylyltransferase MoeB [Pseudomonadota bacterium]